MAPESRLILISFKIEMFFTAHKMVGLGSGGRLD